MSTKEPFRFDCTACGTSINTRRSSIHRHPILETLICGPCKSSYGDGNFGKYPEPLDSKGKDNYCRWCADGGKLIVCDNEHCHFAFCKDCIVRNFSLTHFNDLLKLEVWNCFACNQTQVKTLVESADNTFKTKLRRDSQETGNLTISATEPSSGKKPEPKTIEKSNESEKTTTKTVLSTDSSAEKGKVESTAANLLEPTPVKVPKQLAESPKADSMGYGSNQSSRYEMNNNSSNDSCYTSRRYSKDSDRKVDPKKDNSYESILIMIVSSVVFIASLVYYSFGRLDRIQK